MSFPTGTFSSPYAGRLIVTLTAEFSSSTYNDAGFPSSGVTNLAIRGYAGPSGSPSYTTNIDRYTLTAVLELDYPGASASWPVGVEFVAVKYSGISSATMSNIKLSCVLIKR